jgi:hypothetical protein
MVDGYVYAGIVESSLHPSCTYRFRRISQHEVDLQRLALQSFLYFGIRRLAITLVTICRHTSFKCDFTSVANKETLRKGCSKIGTAMIYAKILLVQAVQTL